MAKGFQIPPQSNQTPQKFPNPNEDRTGRVTVHPEILNQNGDITHLISIGSNKARYWADNVGLEIVYIGANAMPILTRDLKFMLQRFLSVPIRKTLNFITNLIFFPRFNISFFSRDLTMILKVKK